MKQKWAKTNKPGYLKNTRTGFVANTNDQEHKAYLAEKKRVIRIRSLETDVKRLTKAVEALLGAGSCGDGGCGI
jgi:hypothetical protein